MLPAADQHERHQRIARNQSFFREVNENIEGLSHDSSVTFHEFSCECAEESCTETIPLTIQEYEHVRRIPTHFFVKTGHVYPDVERLIETDGDAARYEVVEKFGEAGRMAFRLDPRSS